MSGTFASYRRKTTSIAAACAANAAWQRDLFVSYFKLANVLEQSGSDEAGAYWRQAHDTLTALADAGRFVSAEDRKVLKRLRERI